MWDWNKLSPISGLSLPIEGFPKVHWGKAKWAAQNQGCGGQRWAVEHPGQPLAHSLCPAQSGVPAFTVLQPDEPLAVLRDRAQQISVSLMELPGGRGGLTGEALYPLGPRFAHLCSSS